MSSRNLFLPFSSFALALVCLSSTTFGQEKDIADLANQMESRVEQSLQKYRVLQEEIAAEKVPLIQLINELENQVIEMRGQMRSIRSGEERAREELRAQRSLTGDLRTQNDYVSGLFAQYLNTYEGRLNIAEDQRLSALLNPYREAIELAGPGTQEAREKRTEAVEICLQRLELISGGYSFGGQAIDQAGEILEGDVIVFGPAAFFREKSGREVGTLNYRPGAIEPAVSTLEGAFGESLRNYGSSGQFNLPLDASMGKAASLEKASDNWREHIEKGGVVGYLIIGMGILALLLAGVKLIDFSALNVSIPSNLASTAAAAVEGNLEKANEQIAKSKPWMKAMLTEGAAHANEDRELMEDHMISVILHRKPRLERFLPWLAVTAAATPLMGLLGTVVGMIKTFTLITIFGSGDPKALSSGISEALVTTELGLVVAIPTLIIHGTLLRLAKRRISAMELAATEFSKIVNKLTGKGDA